MAGQSNLVQSDSGMKILLRGILNSLGQADATALTKDNSTVFPNAPKGILGGSAVAVTGAGLIGAANAASEVVGLAINDAVGHAYESTSGAGSGIIPYICGAGAVVAVDKYEDDVFTAGGAVYASADGFLTTSVGAVKVGICLVPPTQTNPQLTVQLRI